MVIKQKHFVLFLALSMILHIVALTSIKQSEQDKVDDEQFKELKITLGSKRLYGAAGSGNITAIPVPTVPSLDISAVEPVAQNDAQKVLTNKTLVKAEISNKTKLEKADNGEAVKNAGDEKTALLKDEQQKIVKVVEQASRKITIPYEEFLDIPQPVVKGRAEDREGELLGNSTDNDSEELLTYEQMLPLWFEDFLIYPPQARALNLEGQAVVRVTIKRDGKVLSKEIEKSTGHDILDQALIDMVNAADPVIPVPYDYLPEQKMLSFKIQASLPGKK